MAGRREIEERIETLSHRLDGLERSLADRAPASEIDRLNLAFDLLAGKAPVSEVERLNLAFDELGRRVTWDALHERLQQVAPASEIERLNLAFDELGQVRRDVEGLRQEAEQLRALVASEIERLNHAFRQLALEEERTDLLGSERSVEIPWVLSKYRGEQRVLEVGYAHVEDRYVESLRHLGIPLLAGLDLAPGRPELADDFARVIGDARSPLFKPESLDLVLMISTIEHIGRDNTRYGVSLDRAPEDDRPDIRAAQRVWEWLVPGGRMLLTVPFGRYEDHGWLINYDAEYLDSLIEGSGLSVLSETYCEHRGGWVECARDDVRYRGYQSLNAPHAGAVAMIELVKS